MADEQQEQQEQADLSEVLGIKGELYGVMEELDLECTLYDTLEEAFSEYLAENPAVFGSLDSTAGLFVGAFKRVDESFELLESREIGLGLCIQVTTDH